MYLREKRECKNVTHVTPLLVRAYAIAPTDLEENKTADRSAGVSMAIRGFIKCYPTL